MRRPHRVERPGRIDPKTGKRKKTVRWELVMEQPDKTRKYVLFPTAAAANEFADEYNRMRSGGVTADPNITFNTAVTEFRRSHYVGLRAATTRDLDAAFKRLRPFFGEGLLRAITPADIEKFREAELKAIRDRQLAATTAAQARAARRLEWARTHGREVELFERRVAELKERAALMPRAGARSVNKAIVCLRLFLKWCQSRNYIGRNAAAFVKKLPALPMHDRPADELIYSPDELRRLLDAAEAGAHRMALTVAAYGGMRIGELLGLQWGDFESGQNRVLVRRQVDTRGRITAPKTRAGVRFVELPTFVVRELKVWQLRCPKGDMGLMFPSAAGTLWNGYNFRGRAFLRALRCARLRRLPFHSLRHGAASMLIAAGLDVATVARQLGHASPQVTLGVYSHWFSRRSESGAGARLEAFLAREKDCEKTAFSLPAA